MSDISVKDDSNGKSAASQFPPAYEDPSVPPAFVRDAASGANAHPDQEPGSLAGPMASINESSGDAGAEAGHEKPADSLASSSKKKVSMVTSPFASE